MQYKAVTYSQDKNYEWKIKRWTGINKQDNSKNEENVNKIWIK